MHDCLCCCCCLKVFFAIFIVFVAVVGIAYSTIFLYVLITVCLNVLFMCRINDTLDDVYKSLSICCLRSENYCISTGERCVACLCAHTRRIREHIPQHTNIVPVTATPPTEIVMIRNPNGNIQMGTPIERERQQY